jgi:hypothetical protein
MGTLPKMAMLISIPNSIFIGLSEQFPKLVEAPFV